MTPAIGITIAITTVSIVAFLIYYFSDRQKILRALSKLTFRRITQFRTNEPTKVVGKTLHVHEPFVAPFSKRKCVAFHFYIEQKRSNGKSSYWKTLVEKSDIQDFFVEAGGEVVMVKPTKHPRNHKIYMVEDRNVSSGMFNDPTPEFEKLLSGYGIESTSFFGFNKRLRYTESIIEVGEKITVGGIAKWKKLTEPLAGYTYSQIATLESTEKQKIIITDDPKAQVIKRMV